MLTHQANGSYFTFSLYHCSFIEISYGRPSTSSWSLFRTVARSHAFFRQINIAKNHSRVILVFLDMFVPTRGLLSSSASPWGSDPSNQDRFPIINVCFHKVVDGRCCNFCRIFKVVIRVYCQSGSGKQRQQAQSGCRRRYFGTHHVYCPEEVRA